MAEEYDPFAAKYGSPAAVAAENDPFAAKYGPKAATKETKKEISTAEDVVKVAAPSVGRGLLGIMTMPSTLADLAVQGIDWGIGKVSPSTLENLQKNRDFAKENPTDFGKVRDSIPKVPNYSDAMNAIEQKTGPWYEAQTPVGKGVAVGLETAPSLLAGGGGILPSLVRSAGAGTGSALAGEGVKWLKDNTEIGKQLPDWAEPAARGVGAMGGTAFAPTARRIVTPLPNTPEQQATINALRAKDPNFPMSAGQETGRPALQALEARSPNMADLPARQERAYTDVVMREMGSQGPYNYQNLKQGANLWPQIEGLASKYTMQQPEFQAMNRAISKARRDFESIMGKSRSGDLLKLENDIKQGVGSNAGQVIGMPGKRYLAVRQDLQNAFESAGHPMEKEAIAEMKKALDDAMYTTMGSDAARLKELNSQYGNYATLKNANIPLGQETITPTQVEQAVRKNWGQAALNENHGTLVPLTRDAKKVMTPMEKPAKEEGGPLSKVLGAAAGAAVDKAFGHTGETAVSAILGSDIGPALTGITKNATGRLLATPPVQAYLKNQFWLPGQNSAPVDRDTLIRLLSSPSERQYLAGGQSQ